MSATTAERPFRPDYVVPPGETIGELLDERDMTQTKLAKRLGVSLKHVNQVVNGAASISAELALGLEKVFGVSADFWVNRESLYRTDKARHNEAQELLSAQEWAERFPIRDLKARDLLPTEAKGTDLVAALLGFLGIASPGLWSDPAVAFRKSLKLESDPHALSAWLRVGELEAGGIDCEPYDEVRFREVLDQARSLTLLEPLQWHPKLTDICASAGVAFVIVPEFKGARANGATRFLSPTKALVQLSLRYKWEDVFWFSFFHEGGHVLDESKKLRVLEDHDRTKIGFPEGSSLNEADDPAMRRGEVEADRFAMQLLIPPEYEAELRYLNLGHVEAFAARLGIAPAIVVGRLQHDGFMPYSQGNTLRRRFEPVN